MKENLELERKDIRIDPELEVDDDNQKQINFIRPPYGLPAFAIVLDRFTAVAVACTALIRLNFAELSSPNCCAILGTSFAASIIPKPSKAFPLNVISPKYKSVVCKNAVKHVATTCFIHCVNPSV